MTPAEELRKAADRLEELADDVDAYRDAWESFSNRTELPEVDRYVRGLNPRLMYKVSAMLYDSAAVAEECSAARGHIGEGAHEVTGHRGVAQALDAARVINGGGS